MEIRCNQEINKRRSNRQSYPKYFLAKLGYELYLSLSNMRVKEALIVYQMGKVGSKTIVESLNALNLDMTVYHVHYLTREGLNFYREFNANSKRSHPGRHYWEGLYVGKRINKVDKGFWRVITLIREPIARNISAFFHALDVFYPDFHLESAKKSRRDMIGELTEVFLECFPHEIPLNWLDSELKTVFGVDVYTTRFQRSKGYKIYRGHRENVLLIRLEDLNRCYKQAFFDFLNIDFSLIKINTAEEKEYSSIYRNFLKSVVLPSTYIDEMYSSKYTKHFYDENEILEFRKKWSKKVVRFFS